MSNAAAIKHNVNVVIPGAARLPADISKLVSRETVGLSRRSQGAEWCDRADHIGSLVESVDTRAVVAQIKARAARPVI